MTARSPLFAWLTVLYLAATPALASPSPSPFTQGDLAGLAFHQNIGTHLPLGAALVDENGHAVTLGDALGHRPAILVLDYLRCRTLCGFVLTDLERALTPVPLAAGRDYEVVAISIDPRDTPDDSHAAMLKFLDGDPGRNGWHFLTTDEVTIRKIAATVGFPYRYDAAADQYAHPAGFAIIGPDGAIARYVLGLGYKPRDLRLALTEAASGALSTAATDLLLLCYCYDPATGRYSANITAILRALSLLTVLGLAGMITYLARAGSSR